MQANQERGDAVTRSHADAEKFFRKAKDLCDENLSPSNPLRFRLDVSQALYNVRRGDETRRLAVAAPPGPEKDRLVAAERSFFLDAGFSAQDALAEMGNGGRLKDTHPLRFEALLVELTAHDAGFPIAGRNRDAIVAALQAWVAGQKAKPE